MNVYAVAPFIATLAYIPVLLTTAASRPWQKRHLLFFLFVVAAMIWSLVSYLDRSQLFPGSGPTFFKLTTILFSVTAVQFHYFISSFYPPGRGRWIYFAYFSLAVIIAAVFMGYATADVFVDGVYVRSYYRIGILLVALPLLILVARNYYVLSNMFRHPINPVLHNQLLALAIGISILLVFTVLSLPAWFNDFPIAHYGNLLNAFILSYAVIRHRLVDIRIVLRHGAAWVVLGIFGAAIFSLLLIIFHLMLVFPLDIMTTVVATALSIMVSILVYKLRSAFFIAVSRAFQGSSFDYRRELRDFTSTIHKLFSLTEQGGELLTLLTRAIGIRQACLLFPEAGGVDFIAQFTEPKGEGSELSSLKLKADHPVVKYLEREQKTLTREDLGIMPEFLGLWEQEKEEIKDKEIEMFMPLISREHLIAILAVGRKRSGRYSLEDWRLLEDITRRVAESMEKEYLREQLQEREEELSLINRSSAIITSSLAIQEIYDSFIEGLKKVVDVTWAAIVLAEESGLSFIALSSEVDTDWQVGEKVPLAGSGTEWVINHKEAVYEPDIKQEGKFLPTNRYIQWGLRSVVHLPLIAKGGVIGSFIVASRQPHAYSPRNIALLEHLAAQIAMPVENARLYAQVEQKSRLDELSGLYNRRSLDEMIDTEIIRHSRYGGIFSLAILDLDSFKVFNDNFGHLAGDKLLRQVGQALRSAIRGSDVAFRYGGDEFAILFPQTGIDAAGAVVERVRKKIADKVEAGDIRITASIGLASWPADGVGQMDIIAAADRALYQAKRSGGNQVQCVSGTLLAFLPSEAEESASSVDSAVSKTLNHIYALTEMVDAKDHYTRRHVEKVAEYARSLAGALDMGAQEKSTVEACALLHEVGIIGVSDEKLGRASDDTDEEWRDVPRLGAAIVGHVPQLAHCVPGILHYREWYDGSGYPGGLEGNDIPLEARIIAIADSFARMTNRVSEADSLSYAEALREIRRGAGTHFDPYLVKKFMAVCEERFTAAVKKNRKE
jgi:diguanylate cyclase (GGDEF)-like protein